MEFYYQTYFSESLVNKKAKIIRKLKQNKIQPGIVSDHSGSGQTK